MTTKPRKTPVKKSAPAAAAPTQVTAASAWSKPAEIVEGHLLTLPSGNVARLRRTLNLPHLLRKGKIPNPLAAQVEQMISSKKPVVQPSEDDKELLLQMIELIHSQLPKIFVEPRIELEPDEWDEDEQGQWQPSEGAIAIEWLAPEDAMFAFSFAQGGPAEVARFREQSQKIVADMANEPAVEGATE